MEYVSNSPFMNTEFTKWVAEVRLNSVFIFIIITYLFLVVLSFLDGEKRDQVAYC